MHVCILCMHCVIDGCGNMYFSIRLCDVGRELFQLLNCVSLSAVADSHALSSPSQWPTWMLSRWMQCVC